MLDDPGRNQISGPNTLRHRIGRRRTGLERGARLGCDGPEPLRVEAFDHLEAPRGAAHREPLRENPIRGPLERGGLGLHRAHARDGDVQVANGAETATDPPELPAQGLAKHLGVALAQNLERGTKPPARHAHVVDVVGIDAEPGAGLVPEQPAQLPPERLVRDIQEPVGVVERERSLVPLGELLAEGGHRCCELGFGGLLEPQPLLHGPLDLAERLACAVLKLHFDLLERSGRNADVVDGERSEQRLPAEPAEALAVVPDPRADLKPHHGP